MMLSENPLISIIALNWNNTAITCDFLRSVREKNTYPNIELILVDNGSVEDGSEAFGAAYPGVRVLSLPENLGFTGGNNEGIRVARGDYYFFVNNDTEFTEGLVEGLLEIYRQYPNAGMVCPKFHYYYQKGTIEYAGYNPVNILTGRNGMVGCREKDEGQYDTIRETYYAHGGAMMVPRRVVDEVGPLPAQFFLYYEELDWSAQIRRKGYKIYYQPKSLIYHKESMTAGKSSPMKTYYLTRNRILFMRRNVPWPAFMVFASWFVCFTIPKNTLSFLLKGQKAHLRSFWKGIFWQFNPSITLN